MVFKVDDMNRPLFTGIKSLFEVELYRYWTM